MGNIANEKSQMSRPVLVILAAGMGSRYGGIKQIETVGNNNELIIDYSIFDAIRANFGKVVFVIRRDIEKDFCERIFDRIKDVIDAEYVFQDMPDWRTKPLGTTQAVLAAREMVGNRPFCVINADDFYGHEAYEKIVDYFNTPRIEGEHAMVGYKLRNTLSGNGSVNRGVIYVDDNDYVVRVAETKGVEKRDDIMGYTFQDKFIEFAPETNVSLTFFGFFPEIFPMLEDKFAEFMKINKDSQSAECIIAETVGELITEGKIALKMFASPGKWYGVTYKQDLDSVKAAISDLTKNDIYPSPLWK